MYGSPAVTFEATLTGANSVYADEIFDLNYGLNNVNNSIYAQDLTITYDSSKVEFVSAESVKNGFQIVEQANQPGKVRILAVSLGEDNAIKSGGDFLKLRWKAKPDATASTTIVLSNIVVANGEGKETKLDSTSHNINIITSVDKAALNDLISRAQSALHAAVEGTQVGQYPVGSKAVLQAAIDQAKAVADSASSTQGQVEQAITALSSSLVAFEASKIVSPVGDLNGDGKISIGDLAIVANYYGKTKEDPNWETIKFADLNNDGVIDIADLAILARRILEL
ncbi:cohesin domain-containing protein [Paenibacillus planticolens]|uniref:cohesin domain-containing protein n=1 Tax=Paenibacillus planticolens TaxID=2654976 RepID=UPI001FE4E8CA|nr:cohesin domain-containing protein [Paenibacillus planticolens]